MSVVRGRPPGLAGGMSGSIRRGWSSLSAWPDPKSPTSQNPQPECDLQASTSRPPSRRAPGTPPPQPPSPRQANPRTLSKRVLSLQSSTKATYRGIIERFRAKHGDKAVRNLKPEHVEKIITGRAGTPAAANNLLRILHVLMQHAIKRHYRTDDPTLA